MPVVLVDLGLALGFVALACLVRPLRWLRLPTRRAGAIVAAAGAAALAAGLLWPTSPIRLPGAPMRLDDLVPVYQFGEAHETRVHAGLERTYQAVRRVTADEIRLFRLLTWLRSPHLPGRGRESILNATAETPLLEVALRSGFLLLADEPGREIVFGSIVCCEGARRPSTAEEFLALGGPGVAKAVMSFRLEDEGDGWTRLRTQTRVFATDAVAERRFATYWRVIYPGSALIRRMWLAAIKQRAEAASLS
jgi:hypothetical protein